jgi:ketosteroid isomerase-like protein
MKAMSLRGGALSPSPARAGEILRLMSEERIEAVRRIYEGWGRGDFSVSVPLFDEHVVFVLGPDFPDAGAYLGREALADYTRALLEAWTRFTLEAEEMIDAGDSIVVAVVQRGVGDSSGTPTEFRYFQVWTFRGAKAVRLEGFREREEALAAAGLPL